VSYPFGKLFGDGEVGWYYGLVCDSVLGSQVSNPIIVYEGAVHYALDEGGQSDKIAVRRDLLKDDVIRAVHSVSF
jgi:hypothetical protein